MNDTKYQLSTFISERGTKQAVAGHFMPCDSDFVPIKYVFMESI